VTTQREREIENGNRKSRRGREGEPEKEPQKREIL
jgi:hypothetical protein